jgi:hypothetical protein
MGLRSLSCRDFGVEPRRKKDVSCECCVLSGISLCDGLATRPEESYQVWCVWVRSWGRDNGTPAQYWTVVSKRNKYWKEIIISRGWINLTLSLSCKLVLLSTFMSVNYVTLRLLMSFIYINMERLFLMFLDHTQRRTTIGRTPLDEWSARRRDFHLTTHDTHNRQISMSSVGFEPTISVGERPAAAHLLRSSASSFSKWKILGADLVWERICLANLVFISLPADISIRKEASGCHSSCSYLQLAVVITVVLWQ